jgi:3-oxoacyl-[acyl-carrier protein] reductase
MAAAAIAAHGAIDVLCCNAGIMPASMLSDMSEMEIDSILCTNIKGTIFAVQACTAALSACGRGRSYFKTSQTSLKYSHNRNSGSFLQAA